MKQNYHAIVIDKKEIGEMDRLYTFYTRENGLMRVVARSIRKVDAKLASQVEDFTLVHISIAKNNGYGILAGAVAERYFGHLRQHYQGLLCVDRVRQIFMTLMREHDMDARMFDLLTSYLIQMNELAFLDEQDDGGDVVVQMRWITDAFLMQFYGLSGYIFDMACCCICHEKIAVGRNGFSAHKGGLLCMHCMHGQFFCIAEPDTIKAMRIINTNHLGALRKVVVHMDVHRQLDKITHDIAQWIMR